MSVNGNQGNKAQTLTEDLNVTYIRLQTYSGTYNNAKLYPMLSVGDTAQPYEPFNGGSYSVTFPTVNVWDEVWENGYIDANGNNASSNAIIRSKNYIPVVGGQSYCFHITDIATMWMSITQYDADKNCISQVSVLTNYVMALNANTKYVRFYASSAYGNTYNHNISINYPSTITYYCAYGEPLTVYGGTPDIVSGEMPVNRKTIALNSLTFSRATWGSAGYLFNANTPLPDIKSDTIPISSAFKGITQNAMYGGGNDNAICNNNKLIRIACSQYDDVESFMEAFGDTQICYELADPVEIAITPTSIAALKGYNAVWSNAGPVEVTAYGTQIVEPDVQPLQAMNLLLGGAYRNNHTPEDVSDEEALNIITGGADR